MSEYRSSLKKRKKYLSRICKTSPNWTRKMFWFYLLILLALAIISGDILMLFQHPLDTFGTFIFIAAAIMFACIPFFIALSVRNTARYKCGFPYSGMANNTLILSKDQLEFTHWRVSPQSPAAYSSKGMLYKKVIFENEDRFVYTIKFKDIQNIQINNLHTCTITGHGNLSVPDWAGNTDLRENIEKDVMSFLLDFEDPEAERYLLNFEHQIRSNNSHFCK